MFYYAFKSAGLFKAILLIGPYLTIYKSQENSLELHSLHGPYSLKNELGPFAADHPLHAFFHNPVVETTDMPHEHFTIKSSDRKKSIIDFFKAVIVYQNTPSQRQAEKQNLINDAEATRIKHGDAKLPSFVQQGIDAFNTTSAFIELHEQDDFFQKLNEYFDIHQNSLIEEMTTIGVQFFKNNTRAFDFHFTRRETTQEKEIKALYEVLIDMRSTLLEIDAAEHAQPALDFSEAQKTLSAKALILIESTYLSANDKARICIIANQNLPETLKIQYNPPASFSNTMNYYFLKYFAPDSIISSNQNNTNRVPTERKEGCTLQ